MADIAITGIREETQERCPRCDRKVTFVLEASGASLECDCGAALALS